MIAAPARRPVGRSDVSPPLPARARLPGLIWVALFVTVALYALLAIAVGGLDPLLLTPVPAWNPLHWSSLR